MQKIISLFQRNYDTDRLVRNEVVPGAEWVLAGEGVATQKFDGTCCMVRDGKLYKRYDAKAFTVDRVTGKRREYDRKPPEGFEPAQDPDPNTGHWPGWVPVDMDAPEDKWHREAWINQTSVGVHFHDDTYELIGPKVGDGLENVTAHQLVRHRSVSSISLEGCPRDFDGLKRFLDMCPTMEGIVFHHPDGRMVKIKRRDFGLPWGNRK